MRDYPFANAEDELCALYDGLAAAGLEAWVQRDKAGGVGTKIVAKTGGWSSTSPDRLGTGHGSTARDLHGDRP